MTAGPQDPDLRTPDGKTYEQVELERLAQRCEVWATSYANRAAAIGDRNWPEGDNARDMAADLWKIAGLLRERAV